MIAAIFFYIFAVIVVASAAMVVTARNPVHCVLFLILTFFNSAALFLMAGAEFLAMILVIVYLGAVAVLFLFVVMMLNIDFEQIRGGFQRYAPVGALIGAIVLTLRHKPNVKRQNVADQVARTKATAIKIRKVQPGQGI